MTDTRRHKYPLQLPASLKDAAIRLAREDGVSLNQWIVVAVAQKIGAVETAETFTRKRVAGAVEGKLTQYLDWAPAWPRSGRRVAARVAATLADIQPTRPPG